MKNKLSGLAVPYVIWMAIFVVAPIIMMVVYAFSTSDGNFTFGNFADMGLYASVFGRSFKLAIIATIICLLIGYPLAFFISQCKPSTQKMIVVLLMLPMWISLLIRT